MLLGQINILSLSYIPSPWVFENKSRACWIGTHHAQRLLVFINEVCWKKPCPVVMPTYLHSIHGCFRMRIQSSLKTLGAEPALGHLFCSNPSLLTCWLCLWIGVQHPCIPFQRGILVEIHRKCLIYLVICPALNTHLLRNGPFLSFEYFPRDHKGKRSQDKDPINNHIYLISMLGLNPRLRVSTLPLSYMFSSLLLCHRVSLCAPNRSKLPR